MSREHSPFEMSSRDINHAAVAVAAGYPVEVVRQAAARRCVFYFADTPEIRELLEKFDRKEILPLPAKAVLNARTQLYHDAARALREAI